MSQAYHSNAKINQHSREIIQNSALTNIELSHRFHVHEKTVANLMAQSIICKVLSVCSDRQGNKGRELGANVRTPFDAIESWFQIKPELFKISPNLTPIES